MKKTTKTKTTKDETWWVVKDLGKVLVTYSAWLSERCMGAVEVPFFVDRDGRVAVYPVVGWDGSSWKDREVELHALLDALPDTTRMQSDVPPWGTYTPENIVTRDVMSVSPASRLPKATR